MPDFGDYYWSFSLTPIPDLGPKSHLLFKSQLKRHFLRSTFLVVVTILSLMSLETSLILFHKAARF